MTKNAREQGKQQTENATKEKAGKTRIRLTDSVEALRGYLRAFVVDSGYRIFLDLLEEERELLCGPRYAQEEKGMAYHYG